MKNGKRAARSAGAKLTEEAVRKMALGLQGVEERPSYGTPGFRVNDQLFLRVHDDGDSLVVRCDFEQRAELMAADPQTYYITDHYLNYEWVLVSRARVHPDALRDLLNMAHSAAAKAGRKARKKKPGPRG
jgi:hypothetical protein